MDEFNDICMILYLIFWKKYTLREVYIFSHMCGNHIFYKNAFIYRTKYHQFTRHHYFNRLREADNTILINDNEGATTHN